MWPAGAADAAEVKDKDPPLMNTWVLWEQVAQGGAPGKDQYKGLTREVAKFRTVKEFWKYWHHLPQPSELLENKKFIREQDDQLNVVDALMVFREGVRPEWEDTVNATGGHFQFLLKPKLGGGQIDEYWNNLVLGVIGGSIEPAGIITGVRLVDKLQQNKTAALRVEIWFENFEDDKKSELEKNLKKCLCTKLDGSVSSSEEWEKMESRSHNQAR